MRHVVPSLTLALFALVPSGAHAAVPASATFTVVHAPHPLALDPALADPAWQTGRIRSDAFMNITTRAPAQLGTDVFLLADERNVYVGFHAEQRGAPVVAGQTAHNVGFGIDDFVGVALDTSGAGNLVYFFETTPRGTRYQQASDNARYDVRWQSAARTAGTGWSAVLIIPLGAMRLPGGAHPAWRFNFIRNVAALGEHYTWAYDPLMADGPIGSGWPLPAEARYWPVVSVEGIAGRNAARPKPLAEIYVLGSGGSDRAQFAQADGTFRAESIRPAGIDVTVPVTRTINVVATLNPDFSNVEIDQQTIVPQEFQRALNEYRPFFAQGAKFLNPSAVGFSSPTSPNNQVFYSPRVGPFDRGVKIEGTFGLQSFGALAFRGFNQTTGDTFDDVAYGYKHALSDRTFSYWADGVIAHHSLAGTDATTELGLTGRNLKSGFDWGTDEAFEHGSWIPGPGVAHSSTSYLAVVKPNWEWVIGYNDQSPNYNPIDGITFNSDLHGLQTYLATSGSTRSVKNYSLQLNADRWFDESGAVHQSDLSLGLTAAFRNGLSINALGPNFGTLRTYDVLAAGQSCTGPAVGRSFFTGFPCYRNGRDARFNLFQTALGYRDGTPQPFDVAVSFGPFGGNDTRLYSMTTSRPVGRLSLGLEYDGTVERSLTSGALDSQWLRRVSLGAPLDTDSNVSVSVRSVNGLGGFVSEAGTNLSLAYHRRFRNGDQLFLNYGTPAAPTTLHRLILKYVFHLTAETKG